jgi:23S rRNA pseudouridine2457 synthase
MIIAFNKPYGVLSRFTSDGSQHRTLAEFHFPKGVYPIGRLDATSEGLLLLSDESELNAQLLHPNNAHVRVYWAQVERIPNAAALQQLRAGVIVGGKRTLPCRAHLMTSKPDIPPPREPPIRFRKNVPDAWIEMELIEGRNHQIRKMTAGVGHPTLRLIRVRIGKLPIGNLPPGNQRVLSKQERRLLLSG